jgi:hypothetical protein
VSTRSRYGLSFLASLVILSAAELLTVTSPFGELLASEPGGSSSPTQYLAFQLFTGVRDSEELRAGFPPPAQDTAATVDEIIRAIGGVGYKQRKLAFIVGPLSFDHGDDQILNLIRESFSIAVERNIAVGFHIDDSMFWGRLAHLHTPENVEWLDWNGTPNTGRRVDWGVTPLEIMPQLCFNSSAVIAEVTKRATLIGEAVQHGMATLQEADKPELFAGVIAGWETQMGRDFATGTYLGYCALTNKGYNAANPPNDMNEARADVTREFVDLWATSLADAGVPDTKIFSHTAFLSKAVFDSVEFSQPGHFPATYLETVNFTPPRAGFGPRHYAGFTTYPQFGGLEQIKTERAKNNNPPWASAEGTALDPSEAERGGAGESMEAYLGNLFNHGAVVVNIFGWGVGNANNPFRRVAENWGAIAAYRKFFRGELLQENPQEQVPSAEFFDKVRRLQKTLPTYFSKNGRGAVGSLYDALNQQLNARRFTDAETTIDAMLKIIEI